MKFLDKRKLKKQKGSALILLTIVTAAMISGIAVSLVKLNSAATSTLLTNRNQMQAQQFALAEAALVRAISYNDLGDLATGATPVSIVGSTQFKKRVTVGAEANYSTKVKMKTTKIEIFNVSDLTNSVIELDVPHYSGNSNDYLPVGSVIAWAGDRAPENNEYGHWIECTGGSVPATYTTLRSVLGSNYTPNFNDRFLLGCTERTRVLETVNPVLPDITGRITSPTVWTSSGGISSPSGAFRVSSSNSGGRRISESGVVSTTTVPYFVDFKASNSSEVYKTGTDSVYPRSIKVRYFIKAE